MPGEFSATIVTSRHLLAAVLVGLAWLSFSQTMAAETGSTQPQSLKTKGDPGRRPSSKNEVRPPHPGTHVAASTVDQLCADLEKPVAKQRTRALKALASIGPSAARAVPAIINVLTDNRSFGVGNQFAERVSPEVTDACVEALTKIGPRAHDAAPYLVQMLTDRNDLFRREQVLRGLTSIGVDGSASKTIEQVAGEEGKSTEARTLAIELLGKIDPPAVDTVDFLREIAADRSDQAAHQAALAALASISRRAKAADKTKPSEADAADATLRSNLASAEDKPARLKTLQQVSDQGEKAAPFVPKLIVLLSDNDADIQRAAIDALCNIGISASAATPALVARLFIETDSTKRDDICRAVSTIDPQGQLSIPLLKPALDDPFKARIALELLDELGTAKSATMAAATRKRWCIK